MLGQFYDVGDLLIPVAAFRKGFFALVVVTLCLAGALALELARKISEPVRALQHGAERIGGGDLQHRIDLTSRGEFGALAGSFNRMADELVRHISNVQEATAARERVESDLRIAREIQESILPKRLPAAAEMEGIAFSGKSVPARQVGGDLYEFFFKDDGTLVLAVGDVSGKGVPAALLMAMTWVLLRTFAVQEDSPATVLMRMHQALLQPMGPARFVSMFLAFYDTKSRLLRFANAGHCPPILVKPDGSAVTLMSTGMPLGVVDDLETGDAVVQLCPGDRLVVYSDGVTEARGPDGDFFGFDRLNGLVVNGAGLSLAALVEDVMSAVRAHEAGHAPHDDTTLWALEAK